MRNSVYSRVDEYISKLKIEVYNGKTIYIWLRKDEVNLFHTHNLQQKADGIFICKLTNGVKS